MTEDGVERFTPEALRSVCQDTLEGLGVPEQGAAFVAEALIETDLRGIASHGVTRLPQYADALRSGAFDARAQTTIIRARGCVAQVDAHGGLGHLAARDAMDLAIERSQEHGIGVVSVRNSSHFGAAFLYPLRATKQDQIGFITTNGPAAMPAFGGSQPAICNNPLSWGIPTAEEPAIILDMACMVAARGKITLAAREGRAIPDGWALDADGRPTNDPIAALQGLLQPVGGAKGYGLAVINEILSGVLSGARILDEIPDSVMSTGRFTEPLGIGHLVLALDPTAFVDIDEFKSRVETIRHTLKASPTLPGVEEVMLPGEPEHRTRQERLRDGIPLEASTVASLRELDQAGRLSA
jgi:LDH2 family malate/lactate/ureidoglycolate dehydrogenase